MLVSTFIRGQLDARDKAVEDGDEDSDEDVILESGPALVVKADDNKDSGPREWRQEDLL